MEESARQDALRHKVTNRRPNNALHPTPSPAFAGAYSVGLRGRCRG